MSYPVMMTSTYFGGSEAMVERKEPIDDVSANNTDTMVYGAIKNILHFQPCQPSLDEKFCLYSPLLLFPL